MNMDIKKEFDETEKQINDLVKKRNKLNEELMDFFIKENNGFFKELEGKCFYNEDDKKHLYLALKYNGYDRDAFNFKVLCADFYYSENNMMYRVLNLDFNDAHYFTRRYRITDKSDFLCKVRKVSDNIISSLS